MIASATTDDEGHYLFEELAPSWSEDWTLDDGTTVSNGSRGENYIVVLTAPQGFEFAVGTGRTMTLWQYVDLADGEQRLDVDGRLVPGEFTFYVPENSPAGTIVGSVAVSEATSYQITNGDPFAITPAGTILVSDPTFLDFEFREKWTKTVIRYLPDPPNSEIEVTIFVTNVNEGPKYNQSLQLTGVPYQAVSLVFIDPEGDAVQSVSGNPQHGVLLVNDGSEAANVDAYWVPFVTPTDDAFTLTASDGNASGSAVDVTIDINGTATFGRFDLGTTPPPKNVDLDPGAVGIVSLVPWPHSGWNFKNDSYKWFWQELALQLPTWEWFQAQSAPAKDAMLHFLDNSGTTVDYALAPIISEAESMKTHWINGLSDLVSTVETKAFIGTINLTDKVAHLGSTANSDWDLAIGEYTGWVNAEVEGHIVDNELRYTAKYIYNFWDPYDWNPAFGGVDPIYVFTQGGWNAVKSWVFENGPFTNAQLHLYGVAQQYLTTGTHEVVVSWTKGAPPVISDVFSQQFDAT